MSHQKAIVKKLDVTPRRGSNYRVKRKSFTFSVKRDLSGVCELLFEGSMTKPFLESNQFSVSNIPEGNVKRAYIDLMQVKHIDDHGIDFLLKLMIKKIEREGVRFRLVYGEGQVGSKVESSGLTSYFAKPTWVYGE